MYTKTTWNDRIVSKPMTFTLINNGDGTTTLQPAEGTITQTGTPLNSLNLNHLETQYDQAMSDVATQYLKLTGGDIAGDLDILSGADITPLTLANDNGQLLLVLDGTDNSIQSLIANGSASRDFTIEGLNGANLGIFTVRSDSTVLNGGTGMTPLTVTGTNATETRLELTNNGKTARQLSRQLAGETTQLEYLIYDVVKGVTFFRYKGNATGASVSVENAGFNVISGSTNLGGNTAITGTLSATGSISSSTGSLYLNGASVGVEIGAKASANTPFLDFNSSGFSNDYDVRLVASGGTNAVNGQGTLTINGNVNINNPLSLWTNTSGANLLIAKNQADDISLRITTTSTDLIIQSGNYAIGTPKNLSITGAVNTTIPTLTLKATTTTLTGALSVTGGTTLSGTLGVTGNTTLNGTTTYLNDNYFKKATFRQWAVFQANLDVLRILPSTTIDTNDWNTTNQFTFTASTGNFDSKTISEGGIALSSKYANLNGASFNGTISAPTINATGNLQEFGTNLSAKYALLSSPTFTGNVTAPIFNATTEFRIAGTEISNIFLNKTLTSLQTLNGNLTAPTINGSTVLQEAGTALSSKYLRLDGTNTMTGDFVISKISPARIFSDTDPSYTNTYAITGYQNKLSFRIGANSTANEVFYVGSTTNIAFSGAQKAFTSAGTLGQSVIFLNNGDVTGANGIYFNDTCTSLGEALLFPRTGAVANSTDIVDYDGLRVYNGVIYLDNAGVLCATGIGLNNNGMFTLQGLASNYTTTNAGNVFSSASGILYRSTSSIKYKKDVEDLWPSEYEKVLDLRPVYYKSKSVHDREDWGYIGLIAEEVEKIQPKLVSYSFDEEGKEEIEGVQYERLAVMLIPIVKQLKEKVELLEYELTLLKGQGE